MIRLRTLGALDLRGSDGEELTAVLAQPRRVALLVFLALTARRGPHSRDALLALFWPERDDDSARNALSQALHFLRRHLGTETFLTRGAADVGIAPEGIWCDASAMEDALGSGRLSEAIDLYRGDFLDGFHVSGAPEFTRWLEAERSRLAARYAHALEAIATTHELEGNAAGASGWWRRLAARDPLSSRVALRLMKALADAGDRGAALHHARVHEALLREELNAAVTPEISALVARLQSSVVAGPTASQRGSTRAEAAESAQTMVAPVTGAASSSSHGAAAHSEQAPAVNADARPVRRSWQRRTAVAACGLLVTVAIAFLTASRRSGDDHLLSLYRKGQLAEISRSLVGLQTARAAYELARKRDSSFALAYVGLSSVHVLMADNAYAPVRASLDSARDLAIRAVRLDSTLADTRVARAITLGNAREFDAAEREFLSALELEPGNARAHYWYSVMLVATGRGKDALEHVTRAEALDPVPPRGLPAIKRYAHWLITGERPYLDSAVTARRPILQLEPSEPWARAREAVELAEIGRCPDAKLEIERAQQHVPRGNFRMMVPVIELLWLCDDRELARARLEEMKLLPGVEEHGYRVAMVHAYFGDVDSALTWLERHQWTMSQMSGLSADHAFDSLRSDQRFHAFLGKLGLRPSP